MLRSMMLASLVISLLDASAWAKSTPRIRETTALRAIKQRLGSTLDWTIKLSGPTHAFKRHFTATTPGGLRDTGSVDMRVHVPHSPHWRVERVKVDLFPPRPQDSTPTWTGFRWITSRSPAR